MEEEKREKTRSPRRISMKPNENEVVEQHQEEISNEAKTVNHEDEFNMKEGLKLLLNLNASLSTKVDTFNTNITNLNTCAYKIDEILVDIDNRLRKLEGQGESNVTSFLPKDHRPKGILGEDVKALDQNITSGDEPHEISYAQEQLRKSIVSLAEGKGVNGELRKSILGLVEGKNVGGKSLDSRAFEGSRRGSQDEKRTSIASGKSAGSEDKKNDDIVGSKERAKSYDEGNRQRDYEKEDLKGDGGDKLDGESHTHSSRLRSISQGEIETPTMKRHSKRLAVKKLKKIPIKISYTLITSQSTEGQTLSSPYGEQKRFMGSVLSSKCKTCGKEIERTDDLITCLIETERDKFICRMCGFFDKSEGPVRKHVHNHIRNLELCHPRRCQKPMAMTNKTFSTRGERRKGKYDRFDDISYINLESDKGYRDHPELISLQEVLSLDQRPSQHGRVDKVIPPHCANCARIFSYQVPMIKKVFEPYQCPPPAQHKYETRCVYVCLVCGMRKPYRDHIELHAMGHVENSELYCKDCPTPHVTHDPIPRDGEEKRGEMMQTYRKLPPGAPKIVTELRELQYFEYAESTQKVVK